jgi:hypothetical protein
MHLTADNQSFWPQERFLWHSDTQTNPHSVLELPVTSYEDCDKTYTNLLNENGEKFEMSIGKGFHNVSRKLSHRMVV